MRRSTRLLIIVAAFVVLYLPITWLWQMALPAYSTWLASISQSLVNAIEGSPDIRHRIVVEKDDFLVTSTVDYTDNSRRRVRSPQDGLRPIDLVSYNLSLLILLSIASAAFVDNPARIRFLVIGLAVLFLMHICDLLIFTKATRSILLEYVTKKYFVSVGYSYFWHRVWWWSLELNRRIIAPFLPIFLWIVICFRSFYYRSKVAT